VYLLFRFAAGLVFSFDAALVESCSRGHLAGGLHTQLQSLLCVCSSCRYSRCAKCVHKYYVSEGFRMSCINF
jgi:hypothetical protein